MGKEKESLVTKIDYSTPEQREKFDRLAKQYEEERERQRSIRGGVLR